MNKRFKLISGYHCHLFQGKPYQFLGFLLQHPPRSMPRRGFANPEQRVVTSVLPSFPLLSDRSTPNENLVTPIPIPTTPVINDCVGEERKKPPQQR